MFLALKICTQSVAQQAFTKPAWTGEKVRAATSYKVVNIIGFVDIYAIILPQFLKTLYAQRIVYHNALIFSGLSMRKDNVFCGESKKRFAHRVNLGYILYF
jgi:hypothetical protein